MVSLVYASGWREGSVSWPASVRVGDLAVLAWSQFNLGFETPSGFSQAASSGGRRVSSFNINPVVHTVRFYTRLLDGGESGEIPVRRYYAAQLLIFRGARGIGATRVHDGRVPTSPGGGAVVGILRNSGQSLPSGVTWEDGINRISYASYAGFAGVGWVDSPSGGTVGTAQGSVVLELLPQRTPFAPELLSPDPGSEVSDQGLVEFQWQHRPSVAGGFQDAFQFRADINGDLRFWNATAGQFQVGEVTNPTRTEGVEIPGDRFSPVDNYWEVRTREGRDGRWSPWSDGRDFVAVAPPSVVVTGPSGTVVDDLRPVVRGTATTPRGELTGFRAQVFTGSGREVHDSGWQPATGNSFEYQLPVLGWDNGASYQVAVQVSQTGGSRSGLGTSDFTVEWTSPATPSITATPAKQGVDVSVTAPAGDLIEIERIKRDGTWEPVTSVAVDRAVYAWTGTPDESTSTSTTDAGTVTNEYTNPDMVATSGEVVVWENLATLDAQVGVGGWANLAGNRVVRTLSESINDHPSGLETAVMWAVAENETALNFLIRDVHGLGSNSGTDVTGVWVKTNFDANGYMGNDPFSLAEGVWTWVTNVGSPDPNPFLQIDIPSGLRDSPDVRVWTTGTVAWDKEAEPFPMYEDFSPDPDLTPQPRPGGGSQLVGQQVAGLSAVNGVVVQSEQWSKSEGVSGRVINTTGRTVSVTVEDAGGQTRLWEFDGEEERIVTLAEASLIPGPNTLGDSTWVDVITSTGPYAGPPFSGRGAVAVSAGTRFTFPDVAAPYGVSTAWRARAVTSLDGMRLTSEWVNSTPVINTDKCQYLFSALDPIRTWQAVKLVEDSEHELQRPTAVAYGLGDTRPRVTYGQHRGRAGTLVLSTLTDPRQDLADLTALLEAGETLQLRWGAEGFHQQEEDAGLLTFSVAESLVESRGAQTSVLKGRRVSVPWVEQTPPELGESDAPITHDVVFEGD